MKKGLIGIGVLIVLLLVAVYAAIPSTLNIVVVLPVRCNVDAVDRSLRDTGKSIHWWDKDEATGTRCRVTGLHRRMLDLTIDAGKISGARALPSRLTVFPIVQIDSCLLQWELSLSSGLNPVRRINRYLAAKDLAADMRETLSRIVARLEDQRQVYGMVITEGNTLDSALVSTEQIFDRYPSDSAVYRLVGKLQQFVARRGSHVTGFPMLNVMNQVDGKFKAEVGLPIDGYVDGEGDIRWRRLIRVVFLEADVHGGDSTVKAAIGQMADYIGDYHRTIMAIPYESLITDRMKERDTTKWLTRLYVPIYPRH